MNRSFPETRAWRGVPPVAALMSAGLCAPVFARRRSVRLESESETAPELSTREKFVKLVEFKLYGGVATRRASAVTDVPPHPATAPAPATAPTRAAPPE